jgi:hypothetical protein
LPAAADSILAAGGANSSVIDDGFGSGLPGFGASPYAGWSAGPNSNLPQSPFAGGGPGTGDNAALLNYWFGLVSDVSSNYGTIIQLFGPGAAAALNLAGAGSPLVDPNYLAQTDPNQALGAGSGSGDIAATPEPSTLALVDVFLAGTCFFVCGRGLRRLFERSSWSCSADRAQ